MIYTPCLGSTDAKGPWTGVHRFCIPHQSHFPTIPGIRLPLVPRLPPAPLDPFPPYPKASKGQKWVNQTLMGCKV